MVLGGRYEVIEALSAEGGIHLYEAQDQVLQRRVALKVCHGCTEAEQARFDAEVRWLANSSGPGRVRVYDVGQHGDDQFAVVELRDVLDVPDEPTVAVGVVPSAAEDLTGETTQVTARHSDTEILPLPVIAAAEARYDAPGPMPSDERRRRGAWILGASAAAALALVIALALAAGGSPHHDTPAVSATSTTVTAAVVTQPTVRPRPTTTTLPPTTTTEAPTTTVSSGFPFDGGGTPPGQQNKLDGAAPVTTATTDTTPVDTTPTTALG